jgi:hypothetical protein
MLESNVERMIQLAFALTCPEWNQLGLGPGRIIAEESEAIHNDQNNNNGDKTNTNLNCIQNIIENHHPCIAPTTEKCVIVERITSLLLVRCVACVVLRKQQQQQQQQQQNAFMDTTAPTATPSSNAPTTTSTFFTNISTSCICQQLLDQTVQWPGDVITEQVIQELYNYVDTIISQYNDVPYHRKEHAYHVVLSVNKLLDMMICGKDKIELLSSKVATTAAATTSNVPDVAITDTAIPIVICTTNTDTTSIVGPSRVSSSRKLNCIGSGPAVTATATSTYVTYGLRHDPIALFSLVFASLIHDVEQ